MEPFDARELRYFVAVAEELNFSRAAERLEMAQPPLSRAIRRMERRLGAELFQRDTRQVTLTEPGALLLDEARYALDLLSGLTRRTQRAAQATRTLVVTAKPGIAGGMLKHIVGAYRQRPEAIQVEIVVSGYREQADMVRDGRADAALLSSPYDDHGLDTEPLTVEHRVAAIPANHPHARHNQLRCRDLDGLPTPRWPGETSAERAYWSGRDTTTDDAPSGPAVNDAAQLFEVVGLGQAVALVPASLAERHPRSDVAVRPVVDASPYTIAIAWPEAARAASTAAFVHTACELYEPRAASA